MHRQRRAGLPGEGYTADAAIIPEPFDELLIRAAGRDVADARRHGVPVHARWRTPASAPSAIAQYLVAELRKLEAKWNEPQHRHSCTATTTHPINFNLGASSGGEWTSSVSTHCRVDMRLGFYPAVTPAQVRAEVEALVREAHAAHAARASVKVEVSYHGFQAEGWWSTCSSRRCRR
jgi:acetylornithine deacetylase